LLHPLVHRFQIDTSPAEERCQRQTFLRRIGVERELG